MTEQEKQMYQILGSISMSDAPIVFKGALITKLVLAENQYDKISRGTVDIDSNWIGNPPSMQEIADIVNQSLKNIPGSLCANVKREYGAKKSAGLNIVDMDTGKLIAEMDISMAKLQESKIYHYGEFTVKGVIPSEIIADKISVISGNRIFRRAKDLIDVYALAHCVEVNTADIYASHQRNGRQLGQFTEFHTRIDDMKHAYKQLQRIENKPDFDDVYKYTANFISPFEQHGQVNKVWKPDITQWLDIL